MTFPIKISKILSVTFEPPMWGLCKPILRPLASLEWEENEVTDARMMPRPIPIQYF